MPKTATGLQFAQDRLKERTASLLNLVDQERKHHQQHQDRRQILFTVTVVVLVVVALVLQRIECLVLDPPTRTPPRW